MARTFLLWDRDGVLVDTERWYFRATREVLRDVEIDLSQEQYLQFMAAGRSSWDLARARGVDAARVRVLRAKRDERYREFLRTEDIAIEGVEDVLTQLASRYRMAVVTTSRRVDLDLIHEGRQLLRHFEFALTIEDYPRPKPEPDPYLCGLDRLGARPD